MAPVCQVGLLYPISKDYMVWTGSAPIRLVKEAGVEFDPANGGRFRASTQAIEGNDNALEVGATLSSQLSESDWLLCMRVTLKQRLAHSYANN